MTEDKTISVTCYSCHKDTGFTLESKIMRADECQHCYANIHSCKMCKFYDASAYNECHENQADRIIEKENANFCDFFILKGSGKDPHQEKDDLLNNANSLFKD